MVQSSPKTIKRKIVKTMQDLLLEWKRRRCTRSDLNSDPKKYSSRRFAPEWNWWPFLFSTHKPPGIRPGCPKVPVVLAFGDKTASFFGQNSKSCGLSRVGSNPTSGTKLYKPISEIGRGWSTGRQMELDPNLTPVSTPGKTVGFLVLSRAIVVR